MMQTYFAAIVERSATGFSAYFPDLPGCAAAGDTMQAVATDAAAALAFHLAGMAEDGDPVPEPTPLDAIFADTEGNEVARLLVLAELPGKSVRLSITMDEGLIRAIDRVAANRSGFLATAARAELARQRQDAN